MGFASELKGKYDEDPKLLSYTTTEDLRKFGMIPEFLGRLPIMVTLQALTKELMVRILTEPKNAILRQYEKLLAMDEVKLVFEDDALEWIAEEALKDVYKRQVQINFARSISPVNILEVSITRQARTTAVSYTHLDVYKRQLLR